MIHSFIIAAISRDGFIARTSGQNSTDWTSQEDKKFFRERTKAAGVMVMGSTTFETIGKALPGRHMIVYSDKDVSHDPRYAEIEVTKKDPQELLKDLEQRGYKEVAICGGASIYTLFMKHNAVQTVYLTVHSPLFESGIPLFNEPMMDRLTAVKSTDLAPNVILVEYQVQSR